MRSIRFPNTRTFNTARLQVKACRLVYTALRKTIRYTKRTYGYAEATTKETGPHKEEGAD